MNTVLSINSFETFITIQKRDKECNYAKRHSNIIEFGENHKTITPSIPARNQTFHLFTVFSNQF